MVSALLRGIARRCPACGEAPAFSGYLKVRAACTTCGEALGEIRADDAPPYFTIFLVGHIVIPLLLIVERLYAPSSLVHALIWVPLTVVLTLAFLPVIKGGTLGLMTAVGIRGDENGTGTNR